MTTPLSESLPQLLSLRRARASHTQFRRAITKIGIECPDVEIIGTQACQRRLLARLASSSQLTPKARAEPAPSLPSSSTPLPVVHPLPDEIFTEMDIDGNGSLTLQE